MTELGSELHLFASAPRGVTSLLCAELLELGGTKIRESGTGVFFLGTIETAYRICLWSRLANRVLLQVRSGAVADYDQLYHEIRQIDWRDHLNADGTLAVSVDARDSHINHTHFASLKIKDAIVDQFRETTGQRPSIDRDRPDVRVHVSIRHNQSTISLDLSGESLHRRGYRIDPGPAPLKENLAAALLVKAGWSAIAHAGGALVDLMCGSGTLPIEAALMAADVAPGLTREYFGFQRWRGHDPRSWQMLLAEANDRRQAGLAHLPTIVGYDADDRAIAASQTNAQRAQLGGRITFSRRSVDAHLETEARLPAGLVVVNPPYGERLGDLPSLTRLYAQLGACLKVNYGGFRAAVLTGNPPLARELRLRPQRVHQLYNGPIPCQLLHFDITDPESRHPAAPDAPLTPDRPADAPAMETRAVRKDAGAFVEMFSNRLRKNLHHLGRWAKRQGVTCYRLYDADMPEFSLAVDLYFAEVLWVVAQEYQAPKTIDPVDAAARWQAALSAIAEVLAIPAERLIVKQRQRQRDHQQYEKQSVTPNGILVDEGGCRFWVNLNEYIDTGLFLDHRDVRSLLRELANQRDFLNLFGYTGSASICAAAGGARSTTTVDLSKTYLDWAKRNFSVNNIAPQNHSFVHADCLAWLESESQTPTKKYGLIFLDPPTFSNSKRMVEQLDIQEDHVALIQQAAKLLTDDGVLIFSTHASRFKMDAQALDGLVGADVTSITLPRDFARHPRVHQVWRISRRQGTGAAQSVAGASLPPTTQIV